MKLWLRNRIRRTRPAYSTLIVVVTTAIVAGGLVVITRQVGARHVAGKIDRLSSAARFAAESTAELIRLQSDSWEHLPAESMEIDLSGMLAPGQTGHAAVTFQSKAAECAIGIRVIVRAGRLSAVHNVCTSIPE